MPFCGSVFKRINPGPPPERADAPQRRPEMKHGLDNPADLVRPCRDYRAAPAHPHNGEKAPASPKQSGDVAKT